jgi:hypothetical protein
MSQLEVDKIIPQSGTTLTIGDSGDTITIASGATLSGNLNADNLTSGTVPDARITGTYTGLTGLDLTDNSKIRLGTGNDLEIYHTGTQSVISDVGSGNLNLEGDAKIVLRSSGGSENYAQFFKDGAVELYYDNAKKFETTSDGVAVTGGQIRTPSSASTLSIQGGSTYPGAKIQMAGGQASSNPGTIIFLTDDGNVSNVSERARIDDDGNFFVATTTEASDDVGHALLASGAAYHTADGTYVGLFNRKSSDGEIVQFRKDNTVIGTIGVLNSDNPFFQGTATNHGGLQCGTNAILPVKNSANSDNTIDLGQSDIRWNDIYLGGGVYIGGTSTPNKLDDYEEGTWTPAFNAGSAGTALTGTVAYSYYNRGYYTKIGRAVSVNFHAVLSNKGTGSGDMWLAGSSLPFASSGVYLASMYQPIYMTKSGQSTYTGVLYGTFDANGGMRVGFYNANSNIAFVQHSAIGNDFTVSGLLTYYV